MLRRNIILLFFVFAILSSVEAQVRPGVKLGLNFNNVIGDYIGTDQRSDKSGDPDNFHLIQGFQVGLILDCPINETIAIQPGAKFVSRGFNDKYTSNGKVERKFTLYYLQVPVNVQYRLNVGEQMNVLFQAGPYGGYGLFGRQKYTRKGKSQDLSDSSKKITFGNGTADDIYKAFDYGVGAGVGFEFYNFQIMAEYELGLYKMTFNKSIPSAKYNVHMQNHGFSFTLAYVFGKKDPLQNKE